MKHTLLKVGAVAGVASAALLAAGPALAAAAPVSQAWAQGIDLQLAGHQLVTGKTTATNDGKTETKTTANTLPGVAGLVPGTNVAGLGVVLQDAYAMTNGFSTACAGLTGQGGGLVQVGDQPCSVNGGQATSLNLATLNLGSSLASSSTIVGQVTSALDINSASSELQNALVTPLTNALSNSLGNLGLVGSLGVVGAECQATPTSASGTATLANSEIGITLGGKTYSLLTLPDNPTPNDVVTANLSNLTGPLLDAVDTDITNTLNNPSGAAGASPLGQLGSALSQLGAVTKILGSGVSQITDAIQKEVIDQVNSALTPVLNQVNSKILSITLNQQPTPQAKGTFTTTALNLQALPLLKQYTGGSLIGGTIGTVFCGPNTAANTTPPANVAPTCAAHSTVPNCIDSGVADGRSGSGDTATIIAAMSVLLAAGGAAGVGAYRRYWMPRG